jgi:hypothetical protein
LHALTGTQVVAAPLHATFSLPLRKKLDKKNKKYKNTPIQIHFLWPKSTVKLKHLFEKKIFKDLLSSH